ncbi:MAG: insulinase family protein [Clostridia bacterium]
MLKRSILIRITSYGNGNPVVDRYSCLTYQDYLDFHSKYYHPSNSYIYLYGNMDFAEKLECKSIYPHMTMHT